MLHLLLRGPSHCPGIALSVALLIQAAFVSGGESLFAQEPAGEDPAQTESLPLAEEPLHAIELSIEQAVEMGLARSFDVRIARAEGTIREREMVIQDAVFDPFLTLSANYSKNRRPSVSFLDIGDAVLSEVRVNPFESSNYSSGIRLRTLLGSTYSLTCLLYTSPSPRD